MDTRASPGPVGVLAQLYCRKYSSQIWSPDAGSKVVKSATSFHLVPHLLFCVPELGVEQTLNFWNGAAGLDRSALDCGRTKPTGLLRIRNGGMGKASSWGSQDLEPQAV